MGMNAYERQSLAKLDYIASLLRRGLPPIPGPVKFGESEQIAMEIRDMAHFMKVRQHFDPVPAESIAKGITAQHIVVSEDGVNVLDAQVGFNPDGSELPADQLPTYWTEVGKNITKTLTFVDSGGVETAAVSQTEVTEDKFTTPVDGPVNIGPGEQIDETDADVRPTT